MVSACTFVGLERDSVATLGDAIRNLWKHDAFVAVAEGDYPAPIFMYAGPDSKPADKGTSFVTARTVLAPSTKVDCDDAELLLYTDYLRASPVLSCISSTVCLATSVCSKAVGPMVYSLLQAR